MDPRSFPVDPVAECRSEATLPSFKRLGQANRRVADPPPDGCLLSGWDNSQSNPLLRWAPCFRLKSTPFETFGDTPTGMQVTGWFQEVRPRWWAGSC